MRIVDAVVLAGVFGLAAAGCTQESADKAKDTGQKVADETKNVGQKVADKTASAVGKAAGETAEIAVKTADKTKEIAGEVATKTKEASAATAEAVTDGWITTKITAKFADETILEGSHIDVDTSNHVVTLKGTAKSAAAKAKAASIASGTKGVTRVINQIAVK
jgi:hyperosmotically inducible periplasmic protein